MTHGEHWSAFCADIEGLTDALLPDIIAKGTRAIVARSRVAGPDDVVRQAEVVEFATALDQSGLSRRRVEGVMCLQGRPAGE